MTFDINNPYQVYNPGTNPYSGDKTTLALEGYKPTGQLNTWGQISSYIPGVNIAQNALAQGQTKGTDAYNSIHADMGERINKLVEEAAIAATIATGGATAPTLGATTAVTGATGPSFGAMAGADLTGQGLQLGTNWLNIAKQVTPFLKDNIQKDINTPQSQPQSSNPYLNVSNYTGY